MLTQRSWSLSKADAKTNLWAKIPEKLNKNYLGRRS